MRFTLPVLSLFLVLLTGEALARPSFPLRKGHNATLAAIVAKRQTNRNEIQIRSHVKETVKRVHKIIDEEEAQVTEALATRTIVARAPTRARLAVRADTSDAVIVGPAGERRAEPLHKRATRARLAARADTSEAPIDPQTFDRRSRKRSVEEGKVEARSSYPKCKKSSTRTGYAHYPGWKLVGDELSGALPVKPESACLQTCNTYGGSCSGVFFDSANGKCYLKGTKTSGWTFSASAQHDGVDLVGGCSLWANIVPAEMDAVCCRD